MSKFKCNFYHDVLIIHDTLVSFHNVAFSRKLFLFSCLSGNNE